MKLPLFATVIGVTAFSILYLGCTQGEPNSSFFASWSNYKVGTETEYQISVVQRGGTMGLPLHYKLVDSSSTKVVLELNLPAAQRVTIPVDISSEPQVEGELQPEVIGARGWPNLLYQLPYPPFVKRLTGHDSVVVDGIPYECRFGTTKVADMKITQWFSERVPGGLVKAEVVGKLPGGDDPNGFMKLTLSKIKLM